MQRLIAAIALIALIGTLPGCATVLTGGPSRLDVEVAEPIEGTTIVVSGLHNGERLTHPGGRWRARLDHRSDYLVTATAPGLEAEPVMVQRSPNWIWLLNFVPVVISPVIAMPLAFGPPNYNGMRAYETVTYSLMALGAGAALIDIATGHFQTHDRRTVRLEWKPAPEQL
jgi:hypothetical protein